jgi:hypothetical protein
METLTSELLATMTLTGGLAVATVWLGKRKAMLEERLGPRRCHSCGRHVEPDGSCVCHR